MQYEVEVKAWVNDPQRVSALLLQKVGPALHSYTKSDRYYRFVDPEGHKTDVRIRNDGGSSTVTYKDKRIVGGVELNQEHEFCIDNEAVFEQLLLRLGVQAWVHKIKRGSAWRYRDCLLELSEVEGLGFFLEVERVLERADEQELETARLLVLSILDDLELPRSAIEERTYTSMLAAKGFSQAS